MSSRRYSYRNPLYNNNTQQQSKSLTSSTSLPVLSSRRASLSLPKQKESPVTTNTTMKKRIPVIEQVTMTTQTLFFVATACFLLYQILSAALYNKSKTFFIFFIIIAAVMIGVLIYTNSRFYYLIGACDSPNKIMNAKKILNWRLFYIYALFFLVLCGIETYRVFTNKKQKQKDNAIVRNITILMLILFNIASVLFLFRFSIKKRLFNKNRKVILKPRYYLPFQWLYVVTTLVLVVFSLLDIFLSSPSLHRFYPLLLFLNMSLFIITSLYMYKNKADKHPQFSLFFTQSISEGLCKKI